MDVTAIVWAIAGTAIAALLAGLFFYGRQAGKDAAENEQMKETINEATEATRIRDRVSADPSYRAKLHERFNG